MNGFTSIDLGNSLLDARGPHEGHGLAVVFVDVLVDGVDQRLDSVEGAAADALLGDLTEAALDEIQPRGTRCREVQVESRVPAAAVTALGLIEATEDDLASVTADAAYDTIAIYRAADARGARVVVPPLKSATVRRGESRSSARDRTVRRVKEIGRRRWKAEAGYHAQARVENAFFRYESIIGDRFRSRCSKARKAEALIACNILNRMTALGAPASCAVDGQRGVGVGEAVWQFDIHAPTPMAVGQGVRSGGTCGLEGSGSKQEAWRHARSSACGAPAPCASPLPGARATASARIGSPE